MAPLNIHPEEEVSAKKKKNNKLLKALLGIAALIAVPVIGTTLAASITINTGSAVQFGQGVVQATACDTAITVTAATTFVNAASAGSYSMGDVGLTGISSDCYTKKIIVSVYPDSSTVLGYCQITNYSGVSAGSAADVVSATTCDAGTSGVQYTSTKGTGANGSITVKFGSASSAISASNVYKVTVESQ